jgi:hypothetical protein
MSKLPREELERIIERDAPGHTLATPQEGQDERSTRAEPEESSPDIAQLRRKYLGEEAAADAAEGADAGTGGAEAEDEIVPVQRTDAADPWDHESRPKTIVVSGKDKKIIGSQG